MCWGAGILLSSGVVRAMVDVQGNLGWRLPFALQWIWPLPLLVGAYLAPESPWNSIRRGNAEEATKSLQRLRQDSPDRDMQVARTVAYIKYTTELEKAETESASYLECFKGVNLRRTEIVGVRQSESYCSRTDNSRIASYGPLRFSAATPSSATPSSSSKTPGSPRFKLSTSTSRFQPATSSAASSAGCCSRTLAVQQST